ncbi:MAG: acyl--CoA ligase, partial [Bdellovibrionales bacterium]|nr:acyl--CoA ligase [Bdellovibrionales bacterium]
MNLKRDEVRRYQGQVDFSERLSVSSFLNLLLRLQSDQGLFIQYLDGPKVAERLTFSEYVDKVFRAAFHLRQLGCRAGDRVMVIGENSVELLVVYGAIWALGGIIVPISSKEKPYYFDVIYNFARPSTVIDLLGLISLDQNCFEKKMEYSLLKRDIEADQLTEFIQHLTKTDKGGALFFTSGTTSQSKGVHLPWQRSQINVEATIRLHNMKPGHRHMTVLPMVHVNAFHFSFLSCLSSQSTLIFSNGFQLKDFAKQVNLTEPEVVSAVPSVIKMLAHDPRKFLFPPSTKYIVTAAAPLVPADVERFYNKLSLPIIQSYGLSEAVNFSLANNPNMSRKEWESLMIGVDRLPAGMPVWGNEVQILSPQGDILDEDQEGEIAIRGWNMMEGYYQNDSATDEAFEGGWLHTGDRGYFKETDMGERLIYITGRLKEIVKRNGQNISLFEVESRLSEILPGRHYAIIGFSNEWTGEEVGLVTMDQELLDHSEQYLEKFLEILPYEKSPKVILLVDEILKTETGKIKRAAMSQFFN